jgi:hypothetical protein
MAARRAVRDARGDTVVVAAARARVDVRSGRSGNAVLFGGVTANPTTIGAWSPTRPMQPGMHEKPIATTRPSFEAPDPKK